MYGKMFGEIIWNHMKKRRMGKKISGNTNRLVIEETDLTLPGKNGLDVVIKNESMIIKIIMKHIVITEITMMMDQIIITM